VFVCFLRLKLTISGRKSEEKSSIFILFDMLNNAWALGRGCSIICSCSAVNSFLARPMPYKWQEQRNESKRKNRKKKKHFSSRSFASYCQFPVFAPQETSVSPFFPLRDCLPKRRQQEQRFRSLAPPENCPRERCERKIFITKKKAAKKERQKHIQRPGVRWGIKIYSSSSSNVVVSDKLFTKIYLH
jgi:hypothetical protein